jgi:aminomethyltransferase
MEQKTAFYDCHVNHGGKIVPFAGYLLPVQYSGVIEEHMAVRTVAGLFDVSHMGEVIFSGKDALKNLNYILTNDFTNMPNGKVRYSVMCDENGGVIDDLLVYKINDEKYLVVVNASNRHKDVKWMKEHIFGEVEFKDISDEISQLALQGPNAEKILLEITDKNNIPKGYYTFIENAKIEDIPCIISRTGYTGEDGFELYFENKHANKLWDLIINAGKKHDLMLCGLGSRDTLRLEAAMPLYGHEMDNTITPLETGLDFGVKMSKDDFIGKKALVLAGEPKRTRVGLKAIGRGIIREHQDVFVDGTKVGFTTSGTFCPFVKSAIAMAILDLPYAKIGTKVMVNVRGRDVLAQVVPLPFYKHS